MTVRMTERPGPGTLFLLFCLTISLLTPVDSPGDPPSNSNDDTLGLSLERLFEDPPLDGVRLRDISWNGEGTEVGFLRPGGKNRDVLELWVFDVKGGRSRLLARPSDVLPEGKPEAGVDEIRRPGGDRGAVEGITGYAWSPHGRSVLFLLGGGLYLLDPASGNARLLVGGADDPVIEPAFSPDGSSASYVQDGDLWLLSLEGGEPRRLTERTSPDVTYGLAESAAREEMCRWRGYWWSRGGRWLAYLEVDASGLEPHRPVACLFEDALLTGERRHSGEVSPGEEQYPAGGGPGAEVRLGILDTYSGKTKWVDFDPDVEYITGVEWGPGDVILAVQIQPRDRSWLQLVRADPRKGKKYFILEERSETFMNPHDDIHILPDSRFVWSSERTGTRQLFLHDPRGEIIRRLTNRELPVVELEGVDEENGRIFFSAVTNGSLELHLFSVSLEGGEPVQLTAAPGWHETEVPGDCRHFVDTFSSVLSPPEVSVHDASGSRVAVLEDNPTPEFDEFELSEPEFFRITAADGRTPLNAVWTKPPGFDPLREYPVVIHASGGPESHAVADRWRSSTLRDQFLARQGYIVLSLDPRGTNHRGKAFRDEIYRRPAVADVEDYTAAVRHLRTFSFIDGERIGIRGWGYGGTLALMSLLETEGLYSCGIAIAPVTSWRRHHSCFTKRFLGPPGENEEAYRAASVLDHDPAGLTEKLLLVHGTADETVSLCQALALARKLQQAGVQFDMMLYPGETHLLAGKETKQHLSRLMFDFFETHLGAE